VERLSSILPYCSECEINMVVPGRPGAIAGVAEGVTQVLRSKAWAEETGHRSGTRAAGGARQRGAPRVRRDPSKRVQCCVTHDARGEVVIVIRDPGTGFDVEAVPDPLAGDNVFKPSGRGIYLINHLMDEVHFADEGREIRMRKSARTPRVPDA